MSLIISRRGEDGHRAGKHMRTAQGLLHRLPHLLGGRTKQLQLLFILCVSMETDWFATLQLCSTIPQAASPEPHQHASLVQTLLTLLLGQTQENGWTLELW